MARCENFKITLENQVGHDIKVTKFQYRDGSKWKTENLLGIDGHKKLDAGESWSRTRNLGGIGNERTCFRVTYHQRTPRGGYWATKIIETTEEFTARDNEAKTVTLRRDKSDATHNR